MPANFDRHIRAELSRRPGQNGKLANDICELLPEDSKERLFRILQDFDSEVHRAKRSPMNVSMAAALMYGRR
jgi:hypothetical protein